MTLPPFMASTLIVLLLPFRSTRPELNTVIFEVEASSFCHQMVRALVGTMVEMGRGHKTAGEMAAILRARSRAAAGDLAPPHGLCLWEVVY